jgi:hypothetical protein
MENSETLSKQQDKRDYCTTVVSINSLFKLLITIEAMLICASISGQMMRYLTNHRRLFGLINFFDLGREKNLPTLFNTALILICSALIYFIYRLHKKYSVNVSYKWLILTVGFLYMAIDEYAELHEKLSQFISPFFNDQSRGIFYFSWVIPALLVVIFLLFYFFHFWLTLPPDTRNRFFIAGLIYVSGIIGVEMIDGNYFENNGWDLTYNLLSTVEESLEMFGLIYFIRALMIYISEQFSQISIKFES